jgi:hypothetical protein
MTKTQLALAINGTHHVSLRVRDMERLETGNDSHPPPVSTASSAARSVLKKYFGHQLCGLSAVLFDTIFCDCLQGRLLQI